MIVKLRAAQAWRTRIKRLLAVLFLSLSLSPILGSNRAVAWERYPDWAAGDPVVRLSKDYVTREDGEASRQACVMQSISVNGYDRKEACVTQMDGWRYALYANVTYPYGLYQSETFFTVSLGADSNFYVVEGMGGSQAPLPNPGTDTLVYASSSWSNAGVYRNFSHHMQRTTNGYRLDAPGDTLRFEDGTDVWQTGAAVARGGGWLVMETGYGIVRANLQTLDVRIVSTFTRAEAGHYSGWEQLGISDDGQTIFAAGRPYDQRSFAAITITDECGSRTPTSLDLTEECPHTNLTAPFEDGSLPDGWPLDFTVGAHGKRLDLYIQGVDGRFSRATLYPYGSAPVTIRYLAMGDSFSSGEGDNDHAYYLPHTDDDSTGEVCHTSKRSYPFRLAAYSALEQFDGPIRFGVRSVACSGATSKDISGAEGYGGQDNRLIGLSTAVLQDRRTIAMNKFIPGRVRQMDFVEEYSPAAITVGIGGNDVQFSQILAKCARSLVTCDYAGDPVDRWNLGESIRAMYPKLVQLYTDMARSDPSARIVAVGYPRFVNDTSELCPLSTNLDIAERHMIDQGVRYLNAVMEASAKSAGIGYVDVGDALAGHRVCDDPGGYVNTIDILNAIFGRIDLGTFHPNELGQAAMALTIERQLGGGDVAAQHYCNSGRYPCPQQVEPPGMPMFFGDESMRPTYIALPSELIRVTGSAIPYVVTKGVEFGLQLALLAQGSSARIELHSESINLGTVTVGLDGTLHTNLILPDSVLTGYHTLHVYATSPSGEQLDAYEVVYVSEAAESASMSTLVVSEPTDISPASQQPTSKSPLSQSYSKSVLLATFPKKVVSNTTKSHSGTVTKLNILLTAVAVLLPMGIFLAWRLWRSRHG